MLQCDEMKMTITKQILERKEQHLMKTPCMWAELLNLEVVWKLAPQETLHR